MECHLIIEIKMATWVLYMEVNKDIYLNFPIQRLLRTQKDYEFWLSPTCEDDKCNSTFQKILVDHRVKTNK